jgi:hypothetical protein
VQEAFGDAVAPGIRQELISPAAALLPENGQVFIQLVQAFEP